MAALGVLPRGGLCQSAGTGTGRVQYGLLRTRCAVRKMVRREMVRGVVCRSSRLLSPFVGHCPSCIACGVFPALYGLPCMSGSV